MSNQAESINKYDVRLPLQPYDLFVKNGEKKVSSQKQTPFLNLECEIRNAIPLEVDGQQVDINGITVFKPVYLTPKSLRFINEFRRACGMEEISELDIPMERAELYFGKIFKAAIECSLEPKKDKVSGATLTDPYTNKPVTNIKREVGQVFCPPKTM